MANRDEFEHKQKTLSKEELIEWTKKFDPKRLRDVEGVKRLSEKEVWDLSKDEQTKIIKSYNQPVPKYEKDRVELIIKLQEDK